jgi:hypothetical protein
MTSWPSMQAIIRSDRKMRSATNKGRGFSSDTAE